MGQFKPAAVTARLGQEHQVPRPLLTFEKTLLTWLPTTVRMTMTTTACGPVPGMDVV